MRVFGCSTAFLKAVLNCDIRVNISLVPRPGKEGLVHTDCACVGLYPKSG